MILKTISFEQKIAINNERMIRITYSSAVGSTKGNLIIKEMFGGYRARQAVDGSMGREGEISFDCDTNQLTAIIEVLQEAIKQKELERMEDLL